MHEKSFEVCNFANMHMALLNIPSLLLILKRKENTDVATAGFANYRCSVV